MIVHTSNRIEDLVALLADLVATPACEPSLGPLAPETIAVQGRGMERWLSMELSNRLGVWANPSFPFPRRLIECAFDAVLGPAVGRAGFEPESLTWVIADLLPRLLERREFAELQRFLAGDADGTRRIQLASRVAETLDHYVSYRPEMISAWEAGQARGEWQATLWREIVSRTNGQHLASRAQAFLASVGQADGPLPDFPARMSLFGITTLPPLWVEVLAALGRRVELHLFLLRCARDQRSMAQADLIADILLTADLERRRRGSRENGDRTRRNLDRAGRQLLVGVGTRHDLARHLHGEFGTRLHRRGMGLGNLVLRDAHLRDAVTVAQVEEHEAPCSFPSMVSINRFR